MMSDGESGLLLKESLTRPVNLTIPAVCGVAIYLLVTLALSAGGEFGRARCSFPADRTPIDPHSIISGNLVI